MDQFQSSWYMAWNGQASDTMVSSVEWTRFRHHGI